MTSWGETSFVLLVLLSATQQMLQFQKVKTLVLPKIIPYISKQKVRRAVRKLPINHCQVITLVDLEEFSYASVAQILDIPVGTVMSRLCRGRRALRKHLIEIKPQEKSRQTAHIKRVK